MDKKKYFLGLLALLLIPAALFPGCGKKNRDNSNGDGYYVNFTTGGKSYSFRGNPYASLSQSGGIYITGIGSFKDQATGTRNVVSVSMGKFSPIKEGDSFSGLIYPPEGGATPAVFFAYIDENAKTFSSLYYDNGTNTVTITGLTAASVKGTFSGKIYDVLRPGAPPSGFSGDFSVKRVN